MAHKSSRRAFFTRGGAVVGAGLATVAGGAFAAADTPRPLSPEQELAKLQDREAIRQLHQTFTAHLEGERYEEAAALFTEHSTLDLSGVSAKGRDQITQMMQQYQRQEAPILHRAYRTLQEQVVVEANHAKATFPVEVELCIPLQGSCTAAQMARMQGAFAERRWEQGELQATYQRTGGQWKIASLLYRKV